MRGPSNHTDEHWSPQNVKLTNPITTTAQGETELPQGSHLHPLLPLCPWGSTEIELCCQLGSSIMESITERKKKKKRKVGGGRIVSCISQPGEHPHLKVASILYPGSPPQITFPSYFPQDYESQDQKKILMFNEDWVLGPLPRTHIGIRPFVGS